MFRCDFAVFLGEILLYLEEIAAMRFFCEEVLRRDLKERVVELLRFALFSLRIGIENLAIFDLDC